MADPEFKDAVPEAQAIFNFFIDKKTLLFMAYNLDCQAVFKEESLTSQESDSSVIGKHSTIF